MAEVGEKINRYDHGPYHWFLPFFYARKYERALELAMHRLGSADAVLDVGCGDGRLTALLAGLVQKVVGVDTQQLPLAFARLLIQTDNVRLIRGDGSVLPFPKAAFDAVTCFDVIEHIPPERVGSLVSETARVLKPRGLLVVVTPNRDSLPSRLWGHQANPKHYMEYNLTELDQLLTGCGYVIEHTAGVYLPPPILRAYLEHYASVFPIKYAFLALIRLGADLPTWSEKLLVIARRGDAT